MANPIRFEQYLNPSQLEAVRYNETPLLVLAGAGSGKTRVITYKIAYLINECGFKPRELLAVTFTNKACAEMRERINELLGIEIDIWIKTFHAAAARLLRIMGDSLGIPTNFTIIDEKDQHSIVKSIIKDLKVDPDTYNPGKYVYLINRAKDRLLTAGESVKEEFSTDPLFFDIYRIYEETLSRENLFDFGDLLARLVRGLDNNSDALARLKDRFRYILIDEFQDTNHAQYVLVKQLTLPEGNICVVGDDDQSIYGFRGARVENILNFHVDYRDTRVIKLEENYRSYQTILTASSHMIDNNEGRLGKTLYTKKGEGEKLIFYRAYSDYGEARYIARQIQSLVYAEGYNYSDIAVFYRMNAQSRIFESVFSQNRIPYTIVGGMRFYEREEIKDMLSYIRLAVNPMDEIALRRIINKPPRGIGQKTAEALIRSSIAKGYPFYQPGDDLHTIGVRAKLVEGFIEFFEDLRLQIITESPTVLLQNLYERSGYLEWLSEGNRDEKMKNLEELYNAVEEFSSQNPAATIAEFVAEASLNQGVQGDEFENNRVYLITLHNAKGLEFPVVFIAGMEEGVFPHYLSGDRLHDIQEERRLCYVGMTRAMERLFLTAAKMRMLFGRRIERDVSNFIQEIPGALLTYEDDSEALPHGTAENGRNGSSGESSVHVLRRPAGVKRAGIGETSADQSKRDLQDIQGGTRIIHKQFGRGRVVHIQNDVAEIQFDDGTTMKFLLKSTPIIKEE